MKAYTNRGYLDALDQRVIVFDGAMGTSLQSMDLTAEDYGGEKHNGCVDYLVISRPDAVQAVHRSYLEAGADVVETDSFRSNSITLADFDLEARTLEINRTAARLARTVADEFSTPDKPRFVAGSMGPSGKLISANDPDLSDITFDELVDVFAVQAQGLIEGGVDLLLVETSQDLLEVKAVLFGIQKAFEQTGERLPIQAQVTLDTSGRMLLGTDISAALTALERLDVNVIGLNCSTGPEHMREPIRYLGEHTILPVSCIPNAGLPLNVDGEAVYPLKPKPFAAELTDFVNQFGVRVVGGCCGTTPEHIRKLSQAVAGIKPQPQQPDVKPRLSSSMQARTMHQVPAPFLIGERINTQGSRAAKRLVMAEDYDAIVALGRSQMERGAHALDVCVALTESDNEAEVMHEVVRRLSMEVDAPLVIDTTDVDVMEVALKAAPGRSLINSVHLEGGRTRIDQVLPLAKAFGAAVIALTIDEKGMAKTVERKLEVARKIYDIAVGEYGLRPDALVFDDLTFTLATGDAEYRNSAVETIEGIRRIKHEFPGVLTSLGVSNVSFGLKPAARHVINSIMLYHAVKAGLDMAIVNPATIRPYTEIAEEERKLVEDLIFNRHDDALAGVIEFYEERAVAKDAADEQDPTENMTTQERLHWRILTRHKEGVTEDIDEILDAFESAERSDKAVEVLNTVLLPAMKEVGEKFGAGELILPFVLQSAEVMKIAVAHLESYLDRKEGVSKGTVVLATVYGDVHDIGKNLVKTIIANNGFTVHDLGKQVPANEIIEKAIELQADAIGLSALLVSTSKQMPMIVNELHRRELAIPILIGGAAINRRFGQRILFTDDGKPYEAGVFFCKDAFQGLDVVNQLQDPEQRPQLIESLHSAAQKQRNQKQTRPATSTRRSNTPAAESIPTPPKWGAHVVQEMPLELVFQHLHKPELFRLSWGAKNTHGADWEKLKLEFEARLDAMKRTALETGWLKPRAVYGYWPVHADGDDLIIYDHEAFQRGNLQEHSRLSFPRQAVGEFLSLADYFLPLGSEQVDMVAFQVVTVGPAATERFDKLEAEGEYSEAYFSHGLAVQTAEATAEYMNRHIRRELNLSDSSGKRYSWGFPAIPELTDHERIFELLPAEAELGMNLTSAYQLLPEQSTAAIVVHHPQAKYFNIKRSQR